MAKEKSAKKQPKKEAIQPLKKKKSSNAPETAQVLSSTLQFDGPLFKVFRDHICEPNGIESTRDVIRHNGSVVILAIDDSKNKRDPLIVMERQYPHAANQYMWELPAGKIDGDESRLAA